MQLQQGKQFAKSSLLRKCGLLAHTSAAFLKNCCTEKLFSRLRLENCSQSQRIVYFHALFHVKQCFYGKQSFTSGKRGFHPCFCLPACCNCPVALSELATLILMIQLCLNGTAFKNAIAAEKTSCKIQFASQMWAARPHLGSIFEKLLHRKTF